MSARLHLLLLIGLLLVGAANPAVGETLYRGEAPLAAGEQGGPATVARALDEVLLRLTGQTEVSLVERFGLSQSVIRQLVLSEQRVRRQRPGPEGQASVEELRLQVDFDPRGVDALLADRNVPRLGRERPSILLWLASEDELGSGFDGGLALEAEISEQGRRLGLDIIRPLGDLQDLAEVELIDIRGGFLDSAELSRQRYGAGMVAMLDLRQSGEGWEGRWFWRLDGLDTGLRSRSESRRQVVADGLEGLLTALAQRFAVLPGLEGDVRQVLVEGIEEEVQYVEVLRYLGSLSVVDDVRVVAARGYEVDFELDLAGPGFEDALAIGGVLDVVERGADGRLRVRLAR